MIALTRMNNSCPAGLLPADFSRISCLFWTTAKDRCGETTKENAIEYAIQIAGDEANAVYDHAEDPDFDELNEWFERLALQAAKRL